MSSQVGLLLAFILLLFFTLVLLGVMAELQLIRSRVSQGIGTDPSPLIGRPIPTFTWTDLWNGRTIDNVALRGEPILLLFVSASCSLCREATASLSSILPIDMPLQLVVVCAGKSEDCSFFCQQLSEKASMVIDHGAAAKLFEVRSYPVSILIDAFGKVQQVRSCIRASDFKDLLGLTAVTSP